MGHPAQAEEALKATILSHIRAIHGPEYPRGTVFDVVSAHPRANGLYGCFVIVYPETKPFKAGEVVSVDWTPLRASSPSSTMNSAYEDLLADLRADLIVVLDKTYKKKMAAK